MNDNEALSRWEDLHNHVVTQTAQAFVTSFLTRCLRANTEHTAQTDLSMVPVVDTGRLLPRYKHSSKRLLLLDFEGAVWIRDMSRAGLLAPFEPQQQTLTLLKRFADDPRNEVWLLSGLPVKGVLDKIAAAVPGVGIVAENGCFIKTRETKKMPGTWIDMVANWNFTWKGPCVEILNYVRPSISLPIPYAHLIDPRSVYRTHARLVCRGTRRLHRLAFLDGSDRRLSGSSMGPSSSRRSAESHL